MGLAFSNNGSSGPWTQAITIDGGLANQWIETWQLTASIIVAGILQSRDGKSFWNLDTGEIILNGEINAYGDFGESKIRNRICDAGFVSYIDDKVTFGTAVRKSASGKMTSAITLYEDGNIGIEIEPSIIRFLSEDSAGGTIFSVKGLSLVSYGKVFAGCGADRIPFVNIERFVFQGRTAKWEQGNDGKYHLVAI